VIALVHLSLALALVLITNWIGRHSQGYGYVQLSVYGKAEDEPSFNFTYRLIAPQVFLILFATAVSAIPAPSLLTGAWHITLYYFCVRWLLNIGMGRARLQNWLGQLTLAASAIGISYWLSTKVLSTPEKVLPAPEDLITEIWVVVILFLYQTITSLPLSRGGSAARQKAFLASKYAHFKGKYHGEIRAEAQDPWVEALAYSILILEDFNRPYLGRLVERWVLFPLGLAKTLGPMQVATTSPLSDAESVRAGTRLVSGCYDRCMRENATELLSYRTDKTFDELVASPSTFDRYDVGRRVALVYNPDGAYATEIRTLYIEILDRFYHELTV
jgi:hypothetical protein